MLPQQVQDKILRSTAVLSSKALAKEDRPAAETSEISHGHGFPLTLSD
jgi:hypothetical protein